MDSVASGRRTRIPTDDLGSSHQLAKEAFRHVEGFARYLAAHRRGARPPSARRRSIAQAGTARRRRSLAGSLGTAGDQTSSRATSRSWTRFPRTLTVLADRRDLIHVFVNLIKNAVEAMQGAPPPRRIRCSAAENAGTVVVEVANSGGPIDEELLPRLFERGFTTKAAPGRGRGLALVRALVEKSGGWIGVRNDESGVVFSIVLPKASN